MNNSLTRNDLRAILFLAGGLIILGVMTSIYDNNDDLRGRRGQTLYAKEALWREGRPPEHPPTVRWNAKVEGLLYDDDGDVVFRWRGQYFVARLELFSDVPLDVPPTPAHALSAAGGAKG